MGLPAAAASACALPAPWQLSHCTFDVEHGVAVHDGSLRPGEVAAGALLLPLVIRQAVPRLGMLGARPRLVDGLVAGHARLVPRIPFGARRRRGSGLRGQRAVDSLRCRHACRSRWSGLRLRYRRHEQGAEQAKHPSCTHCRVPPADRRSASRLAHSANGLPSPCYEQPTAEASDVPRSGGLLAPHALHARRQARHAVRVVDDVDDATAGNPSAGGSMDPVPHLQQPRIGAKLPDGRLPHVV